jgi:predicted CXXCH cytochrome family protein
MRPRDDDGMTTILCAGCTAWLAMMTAVLFAAGQGATERAGTAGQTPQATSYAGSAACARCHGPIYDRWKRTRMANVVRDPKENPDAIIPDLNRPDPLLTFKRDGIAFVYGSKWKQRYFTRVGDDYFPLSAQWDVAHRQWRPYNVAMGTDWWTAFYPPENSRRPTGPTCDGCHSVNYDVRTKQVTEWNVGCEKCHGPGSEHVARQGRTTIVNPARLDPISAVDVCIQCHSQGKPHVNPVEGRYFDWPVGFRVGLKLKDYWTLEEFKPGETTFTHFPDGSAHKNRMQGNDFVQSAMYTHGVTCSSCHDVHGTENNADLVKSSRLLCLTCHGPKSPNGPHAATIEQHTHHQPGSAGGECVSCHMPAIAQTIADINVRSHTFRFITPAMTETLKIPNPCTSCHKDKTNAWATETLRSWPDVSPWRIGQ